MTIAQLRAKCAPLAAELYALQITSAADDFAPWVVAALAEAASLATLSDDVLRPFKDAS